jgi:hypothetical protein
MKTIRRITNARSRFPVFLHGLGSYPNKERAEQIEHRVRTELKRAERAIELVRVYVEDINGPRGGIDEACRIVVQLPRGGCVAVAGRGSNLLATVSQTLVRAGLAVRRHIQRRKTRRRRHRTRTQLAS